MMTIRPVGVRVRGCFKYPEKFFLIKKKIFLKEKIIVFEGSIGLVELTTKSWTA